MKAMSSELALHRQQVSDLKLEQESLHQRMAASKKKYFAIRQRERRRHCHVLIAEWWCGNGHSANAIQVLADGDGLDALDRRYLNALVKPMQAARWALIRSPPPCRKHATPSRKSSSPI